MTTIKATVHNGRIDVPAPSNLPDGTEVILTIEESKALDDGPMSPEEIARVLAAMERIEPFDWTSEERAAADAWEKKLNDYTIANFDRASRMCSNETLPPRHWNRRLLHRPASRCPRTGPTRK